MAGSGAERAGSAFKRALALHQQSRLEEARVFCRKALRWQPRHFKALHLLGAIDLETQHPQRALEWLGEALLIEPRSAAAHNDHGNALSRLGQRADAIASYERAIALQSDFVDAHYNRSNELLGLQQYAAAIAGYERAIELKPDHAQAYNNRGNALLGLQQPEAACNSYEQAVALSSGYADAWHNRGIALQALRRYEDAVASFERAVGLRPDYASAFAQRGKALLALHGYELALESFERALALRPGDAGVHYAQGNALYELGRYEAAVASYDQAIALAPDYPAAHNDRGAALAALKQYAAAIGSYEHAIALKGDYAEAFHNRGNALQELEQYDAAVESYSRAINLRADYGEPCFGRAVALAKLGRHESALADYDRALALKPGIHLLQGMRLLSRLHICDWAGLDADLAQLTALIERGEPASGPFAVLTALDSPALQQRCARILVRELFPMNAALGPVPAPEPARQRRLRIGYFSADFHNHATLHLMAGLFEMHDRSRFECTAFSFGPHSRDGMRQRLEAACEHFIDVQQQSDQQVALLARARRIDIAVDLKGFTAGNRSGIFALRAAPLQVSYLGYPGTMGAPYIDYLLADRTLIPEEAQRYYSEQVIYLPGSYQINDSQRAIADRSFTRQECGLPPTGFVFCCFNNSYKIMPETFELWMRILRRVEGSVLWLLEDNPAATRNLRQEALRRGIDRERLVFAPRLPLPEHLARHRLADLFLDTLPCNAHTTASDALWAGLPLLTRAGEGFAARVASSLLHAVGLAELVTSSPAQYEELAFTLATQPQRLAHLRERLGHARITAPLFNTCLTTRHVESAYTLIHEHCLAGLSPESISVPSAIAV